MAEKDSPKQLDSASLQLIQYGGTLSDLAAIFRMDRADVKRKIAPLVPSGVRGTVGVYLIHEVAPYLVRPVLDNIGDYIRRMHPNELPKQLTKEYWAGQRSRQDYEEKAGTLWRQDDVIRKVSELVKLIKMTAQLAADTVERQAELTENQKNIIRQIHDGMLVDLRESLMEHFGAKVLVDASADEEL
jgi:hypothetical protein